MGNEVDRRKKDTNWYITDGNGSAYTEIRQGAILATLMDIRDEMKKLNRVFECYNFQRIPRVLDRISANTHKPKKRKPKSG